MSVCLSGETTRQGAAGVYVDTVLQGTCDSVWRHIVRV